MQMASILALSLIAGHLLVGQAARKLHWSRIVSVCLLVIATIVTPVLPQVLNAGPHATHAFSETPATGFTFPPIGLFTAPIYPLLSSAILSALPQQMYSSMTGLIMISSALGGMLGSCAIDMLFQYVGGA